MKFPDAPKRYLVGDDGSIYGLIGPSGKALAAPVKLRPHKDKKGYYHIGLRGISGRKDQKRMAVHTIVCRSFHGERPGPEYEVAHWDGDRENNRASNLRWATRKENAADRTRHSRTVWGEATNTSRLNPDAVEAITILAKTGFPVSRISAAFRVSAQSIYKVINKQTWVDPATKVRP